MALTRDDFKTDIVGESNYFDTLEKCYFDPNALDCDGGKAVRVQLIKEPTNLHDKNAVAVLSSHGVIGYLSRANAKKYHKFMPDHLAATVDCSIWTSDPDEGIYGAWLGIDLDNPPNINQQSPIKPLPKSQKSMMDEIREVKQPKINQKRKKFFGLF